MKIYIGNLHTMASERKLYGLFIAFGHVLLVDMPMAPDGRHLGYAYVHMKESNRGMLAIKQLNGFKFMNQFLEIFEVG